MEEDKYTTELTDEQKEQVIKIIKAAQKELKPFKQATEMINYYQKQLQPFEQLQKSLSAFFGRIAEITMTYFSLIKSICDKFGIEHDKDVYLSELAEKIYLFVTTHDYNTYELSEAEKTIIQDIIESFSEEKARKPTLTKTLQEYGNYMLLPQQRHTNNLAHILATKKPAQLDLNGKATITGENFKLYIEGYNKLVSRAHTSAVKLLDALAIACNTLHDPLARIPLKEYMELRGLKDEKETRKQVKRDMEVLKSISIEYRGTGKNRGDWLSLSLYGGRAGIYKGIIEFRFTPEFYASIPENQFMYLPKEYFATNDKYNPHTAYFIRRIAEHKRMNLGKANENIISVETLINSSPLFPKYEETKGSHFMQLILEPFERDMDAIKSIKWHYAEKEPENYDEFINANVIITWIEYPKIANFKNSKKRLNKGKNQLEATRKKGGNGAEKGG